MHARERCYYVLYGTAADTEKEKECLFEPQSLTSQSQS